MYILLSVNWCIFPSVNLTKTRWTTTMLLLNQLKQLYYAHLTILSYRMHIVPKQNISFDEQASAIAIRKWMVVQLFLLQWRTLKMTRAVLLNVDDVTI